jgi:putative hydroxymethylpyrimidine transport system ATP-binding protein
MLPIKKAPSIHLQQVNLAFDKQVLFKDLNLTFNAGKWTCLLGPSGVGKSTLLKLISQLLPNNSKQQTFSGKINSNLPQALTDEIAYMAQADLLLPWFSAFDNALLGARLRGKPSEILRLKAKKLFAETGLAGAENKFPAELSGGMRQRVALVRTLLEEKSIILMDEPFSAVDAVTRYQLQELAAKLLQNHTVILVTHDPSEALRLANDIYILSGLPVQCDLILQLQSTTPRDINHPEFIQHQAALFHALVQAKEINS